MLGYRYTQQTVAATWQFLLKSAESYGVLLKGTTKEVSITNVAVDLFNNDLFNDLSSQHQNQLSAALVNSATCAENASLYINFSKFFKQSSLNARICVKILDEMAKTQSPERMDVDDGATTSLRQHRNSQSASDRGASTELLKLKSWKRGITWVEFLQNKTDIHDSHLMIPALFAVLQKCLQFEDQSNLEYPKQLTLAWIYHLLIVIAPDGKVPNKLISEKNFKYSWQLSVYSWHTESKNTSSCITVAVAFSLHVARASTSQYDGHFYVYGFIRGEFKCFIRIKCSK